MRRRYGGYRGRKRPGSKSALVLTILFWAVSGFIMLSIIHGGPPKIIEAKSEDVAKLYIGSIFPTVSRGADYESREAVASRPESLTEPAKTVLDGKQSETILKSLMGSMFPAAQVLNDDLAEEDPGIIFNTGSECSDPDAEGSVPNDGNTQEDSGTTLADIDRSKPVVIIYHTHATESYQPVTEGNFHVLKEYGTVREVGNVLTKELEKLGVQVIHDKTIHDSPSYNQSYTRSLETIQTLMGNIDTTKIMIDLHRDAAGYVGNVAKTVTAGNDTMACYSLVVGTGNPNVDALRKFAGQINKKAEELYPGFGGRIIEKQYKFNQYVSDNHLLLEVGNNENSIEQAKMTGKYFAHVLAEVIKDLE